MSHHTPLRRTAGVLGAAAGLTAAVLLVASCSASPPHQADKHGAPANSHGSTARTHDPGTSAPPTGTSTGQLGTTLPVSDSSGTQLDVTLKKVVDPGQRRQQVQQPRQRRPLRRRQAAHSQRGHHHVPKNNANNETTVTLSNGKTLHADYNPIAGCGNFDNGQVTLKAGATSTGCITFQLPKGQKVTHVGYSNTVFPGKHAKWQIS